MSTHPNYIHFCLLLTQTQAQLARKWDQALSAHGISFTEFMILHSLHQAPNHQLRRVDLAEQVSLTASGVTRLLAPMEKIGLVQKETNQRDARVSLVKITPTGQQILQDATLSLQDRATGLLSAMNLTPLKNLLNQLQPT